MFYFEDMIGKQIYAKRSGKTNGQSKFQEFGYVVDETEHTLICSSDIFGNNRKILIKNQYIFRFHEYDESGDLTIFEIKGGLLCGTPEHRIKSIRKKRLKVW